MDFNIMNVNKIKNAFSFIGMEGVATKITTLCLISGIGILLFTQHIIFSSSGKALHSPQNPDFAKTDFSIENFINGQPFSGKLMDELAVLTSGRSLPEKVVIELTGFQNLCIIPGFAHPSVVNPDTIEISFKEITCKAKGIIENHEIDGRIINIKAATVPVSIVLKQKIQSLKNDLKTKTDEKSKDSINRLIKKIEESETALVLPALTKIRGRIIRNDGKDFTGLSPKVIIETLNIDL